MGPLGELPDSQTVLMMSLAAPAGSPPGPGDVTEDPWDPRPRGLQGPGRLRKARPAAPCGERAPRARCCTLAHTNSEKGTYDKPDPKGPCSFLSCQFSGHLPRLLRFCVLPARRRGSRGSWGCSEWTPRLPDGAYDEEVHLRAVLLRVRGLCPAQRWAGLDFHTPLPARPISHQACPRGWGGGSSCRLVR